MLLDGPYPWHLKERIRGEQGHLSNDDAADALRRFATTDTSQVVLAHLSAENNLPQLALDNAAKVLRDIGLKDAKLSLAPRYQPLPLAQVG